MSWGLGVGSRSKGGRKGLAPAPSVTRWSAGGGRESHRPKRHTFRGENLENLVPPLTAWSRVSRAAGASVSPFVKRSWTAFLTTAHLSERPAPGTAAPRSAGEDGEPRRPRSPAGAPRPGHAGGQPGAVPNAEHSRTMRPAVALPGIYPDERKTSVHTQPRPRTFAATALVAAGPGGGRVPSGGRHAVPGRAASFSTRRRRAGEPRARETGRSSQREARPERPRGARRRGRGKTVGTEVSGCGGRGARGDLEGGGCSAWYPSDGHHRHAFL